MGPSTGEPSVREQINEGLRLHSAGRLHEAEAVYRGILTQDPRCPAALHLLGVAHAQQKKHDEAARLIRQAVALAPEEPVFHANLALAYIEMGRADLALPEAQRAVQLNAADPDANNHLGNALRMLGRTNEAIAVLQGAIKLKESFVDALQNLALALKDAGRFDEAAQCLQRAGAARPNDPKTALHLGAVLFSQKRYADAAAVYERTIAAGGADIITYANLALAYQSIDRLDDAIAACRRALEIDPAHHAAHNNLGFALATLGRLDEAIAHYCRAVELRPDNPDALNNLANALEAAGRVDESFATYARAIYFKPDHTDAHWNRSLLRLQTGDFENGWHEYEWRWLRFPDERRLFAQPQWDGFDIAGKSILLHAEQGLGDAIQFARFAPLVAAKGATVYLECQPALAPLMKSLAGVKQIIPRGEQLTEFDTHCPLLSLPYALGVRSIEAIPAMAPYLSIDPARARQWGDKLGSKGCKRVGLAWSGSTTHAQDRWRSVSLEKLTPLFEVPNLEFISLQKQLRAADAPALAKLKLLDPMPQINDFADSAAIIANLDLVITVDTAPAHLAGALGAPVWILLPYNADWRWMRSGDRSPWYPSARLYRPPARGAWDIVLAMVERDLRAFASQR